MPSRKIAWPFSFYFLYFEGVAAFGPYRVLYDQSLSFTGAQIRLLAGITPLITLFTLPLVTGLADRSNKHKPILSFALLIVISGQIIFPYLTTFSLLFGLVFLFSIFFSAIMPLTNSATLFMLGDRKGRYGRSRLGGTLGFGLIATAAVTLVENFCLKIAFFERGDGRFCRRSVI